MRLLFLVFVVAQCSLAQVVPYVESLVERGSLAEARSLTVQLQKQRGETPEVWACESWIARGELQAKAYPQALNDAENLAHTVKASLGARKLESNPYSPLALGAAYEVQAQALVALKRRSEALTQLQNAIQEWKGTSIESRLQKNLLLLTMVGHPLPPIQGVTDTWRGKPVLLFFWAHWCADCKADAPIVAQLAKEFEPKGLVVLMPTRLYGYTAQEDNAPAAEEQQWIKLVFQHFYADVPNPVVVVNNENFERFGASTTPTVVAADRRGIVRLYHPGYMDENSLRAALQLVTAR